MNADLKRVRDGGFDEQGSPASKKRVLSPTAQGPSSPSNADDNGGIEDWMKEVEVGHDVHLFLGSRMEISSNVESGGFRQHLSTKKRRKILMHTSVPAQGSHLPSDARIPSVVRGRTNSGRTTRSSAKSTRSQHTGRRGLLDTGKLAVEMVSDKADLWR